MPAAPPAPRNGRQVRGARVPTGPRVTRTARRVAGVRVPTPTPAARRVAGVVVLAVAVGYLTRVVDGADLARVTRALLADPLGLAAALASYAAAFGLRTWAWRAVLPRLSGGQSWAALHVSLLGNHVLPFRLGEPLRITSVLRRTNLPLADVTATALMLRLADILAVAALALATMPGLLPSLAGDHGIFGSLPQAGWVALAVLVLAAATGAALVWVRRLAARGSAVRLPGPPVWVAVAAAWALEAAVVWEVARTAGIALSPYEAVAVTAATIAAQTVAVTPGGLGSYEAAATGALVALGAPAGPAFAVALTTHAVKTVYSVALGGIALFVPAPSYWGRFRLPRSLPPRPGPLPVADEAPIVAIVPVHNEAATIAEVIRRLPPAVGARRLTCLVIDDGSTDDSARIARDAGAVVVPQPCNLGLGAAVRRGLAEASALVPAAVVYLDADLEYLPEEAAQLLAPVLSGEADYVVGSRFAGRIRRMHPHRRLGNRVLTAWVRWLARRRDITDGQSGYRALSPRAAADAEIVHDYNYAQVLTLDLLAKGYVYREVPINYAFRQTGDSFVKLGRYLRKVIPAVHRELNTPTPALASGDVGAIALASSDANGIGRSVFDDVGGEAGQGALPGGVVEPVRP